MGEEKKQSKKLKKEVKELKKREKLEKKGKKKSKKLKKTTLSDEEDITDEYIKSSLKQSTSPGSDSDEELFRFFEEQQSSDEKKEKKKSLRGSDGTRSRRSSGEKHSHSRKKSSPGIKVRLGESVDGEREAEEGSRIKQRLGKKVGGVSEGDRRVLGKGARRGSDELLLDLEKFQGSTDEESLDILEKMKRKNEKRLRRMRE